LPAQARERILAASILSNINHNISKRRESSMKTLWACAVITLLSGAATVQLAAAADADPVVGTWLLNAAKSKFTAGPAVKSQTRKYSQSGDKLTLDMTTVTADGKEVTTHTTYELNGKDFPVTGTPDYDSLAAKKVNPNTAEFTLKKGGKAVGTTSRTVSKDGKTLTTRSKITTPSGEKSENVMVFDRQ
jgi:hypothetical protein